MSFNYQREKLRFLYEWEFKRKMMEKAGMSEENIKEMRDFDWEWFKSIRRFDKRRVDIDLEKFYSPELEPTELQLLDTLDDIVLFYALKSLADEEIELLFKTIVQKYRQVEIATEKGVDKREINRKIKEIKKKLKIFLQD